MAENLFFSKGFFDHEHGDNNHRGKLSYLLNNLAGRDWVGLEGKYVWDARD